MNPPTRYAFFLVCFKNLFLQRAGPWLCQTLFELDSASLMSKFFSARCRPAQLVSADCAGAWLSFALISPRALLSAVHFGQLDVASVRLEFPIRRSSTELRCLPAR